MSDAQSFAALRRPRFRGLVTGASLAMSALGMRTFSGVTVGLGGSLVGIHGSLALSAAALLALLGLGFVYFAAWKSGTSD